MAFIAGCGLIARCASKRAEQNEKLSGPCLLRRTDLSPQARPAARDQVDVLATRGDWNYGVFLASPWISLCEPLLRDS